MNSKEALERLFASYNFDGNYHDLIKAREKLEQDLDRLEKLEKENQELRKAVKSWNENGGKVIRENTKLKKAFDVLKDKKVVVSHLLETKNVEEYNFPFKNFSTSFLTQEEYELLKNTLGEE